MGVGVKGRRQELSYQISKRLDSMIEPMEK
jgi:hypothetical protein